jgi:hypothetical protein
MRQRMGAEKGEQMPASYEVTFDTFHETFGPHKDIVVAHASGVGDLMASGDTYEDALYALKREIAWRHETYVRRIQKRQKQEEVK